MSGNVFTDTVAINCNQADRVLGLVRDLLPAGLTLQPNIGSAGFKPVSGDMDIFLDQQQVISLFDAKDEKLAKQELAKHLQLKGLQTAVKGRNVHARVPISSTEYVQVDLMIIPDAEGVAPWHQHGPRGSYEDPDFKGADIFIVMNSIGKALGFKFDAFSGRLLSREDNSVVATGRDAVAKLLLNPQATGRDLDSVKTILNALETDKHRDAKLAQARGDAERGLIKLFERELA